MISYNILMEIGMLILVMSFFLLVLLIAFSIFSYFLDNKLLAGKLLFVALFPLLTGILSSTAVC